MIKRPLLSNIVPLINASVGLIAIVIFASSPNTSRAAALFFGGVDPGSGTQFAGRIDYNPDQTPSAATTQVINSSSNNPDLRYTITATTTDYTYQINNFSIAKSGGGFSTLGSVTGASEDITTHRVVVTPAVNETNYSNTSIIGSAQLSFSAGSDTLQGPVPLGQFVSNIVIGPASYGGYYEPYNFNVTATSNSFADLVVKGGVQLSTIDHNTRMEANFTPNFGLKLQDASDLGGYQSFNWVQLVEFDPNPPAEMPGYSNVPLTTPYIDPPLGGYVYQLDIGAELPNNFPFYLNTDQVSDLSTDYTLNFNDRPVSPGSLPSQAVDFVTMLVGVLPGSTTRNPHYDILSGFQWTDNYTGCRAGLCGGAETVREGSSGSDDGEGGIAIIDPDLSLASLSSYDRQLLISSGADNLSVPEPDSWMLLILGFGITGTALRRKRFLYFNMA